MDIQKLKTKIFENKILGFNKYLLILATAILTVLSLNGTILYDILSSFWMWLPAFIVAVIAFIAIFLPIITYRYLKKYEKSDTKELPRSFGILSGLWYLSIIQHLLEIPAYYFYMVLTYGNVSYLANFRSTIIIFTIVLILKLLFISLLLRLQASEQNKKFYIDKTGVSKIGWTVFIVIIVIMTMLSATVLKYTEQIPQVQTPVVEKKDTWTGAYFVDCEYERCKRLSTNAIDYDNINGCINKAKNTFSFQKQNRDYNPHTHIKPEGLYVCALNCSWPPNGCEDMRIIPYDIISAEEAPSKIFTPEDFLKTEFKLKK